MRTGDRGPDNAKALSKIPQQSELRETVRCNKGSLPSLRISRIRFSIITTVAVAKNMFLFYKLKTDL